MQNTSPAGSYKFNNFKEIKSHSSVLFNERLAILFYWLDIRSMEINENVTYVKGIYSVRATLKQIYKNIRTLIRNNPMMRATLNLETKDSGIYTTDVALAFIDKMLYYCETNSFTKNRCQAIVNELNDFEVLIKDILQYYSYFIRPDFKQKPDIEQATEKYKTISDSRTVEELREIVGKNNKIDFETLKGSSEQKIGLDDDFYEEEND